MDFQALDLRPECNSNFCDSVANDRTGGWFDQGAMDMRNLPSGNQVWCGIPFKIIAPEKNDGKSCLIFRGYDRPYFLSAASVKVNARYDFLYFLQTAGWVNAEHWGGLGATYQICYADGTSETLQVVDGKNTGDWIWARDIPGAELAWIGLSGVQTQAVLWMMPWQNPFPEKIIDRIDITSAPDGLITALVAITGGPGRDRKDQTAAVLSARGIITPDRETTFRTQEISGTLRLPKSIVNEHLSLQLWAGETLLAETIPTTVQQEVSRFAIVNQFPEGLYQLKLFAGKQLIDQIEVVSMGSLPDQAHRHTDFSRSSLPVNVMICYLKDEATLARDFADMKNKGFDVACLEFFWDWLEAAPGKYTFAELDRVAAQTEAAGLDWTFYLGFWRGIPNWVPKINSGEEMDYFDPADPQAVAMAAQLYGQVAARLKNIDHMTGYVVRLHYYYRWIGKTAAGRRQWQAFLAQHGYTDDQSLKRLYDAGENIHLADGTIILPSEARYGNRSDQRGIALWRMVQQFGQERMTAAMEQIIKAIRDQDPVKPIRLMFAQSYEPQTRETSGFSQTDFHRLAQRYNGMVHVECYEWPIHPAKDAPLAQNYKVIATAEGGDVPCRKTVALRLFAHCVKYNPPMVAYCEYNQTAGLSREDMFSWVKYKPFWRLRRNYDYVTDNFYITSFWKDSWAGEGKFDLFYQNHVYFNNLLTFDKWSYNVVNEDLLRSGMLAEDAIVLDTNSVYLGDDVAKNIAAFVNGGGIFIANYLTGYNEYEGGDYYSFLHRYFKVKFTDFTLQRPGINAEYFKARQIRLPIIGGTVKFNELNLTNRSGYGIETLPGDTVLARWQNGDAAAIIRPAGAGKLILIGFSVEKSDFANGVQREIMRLAGIRRRLNANCDEAGLAFRPETGGYFISLLHGGSEAKTVDVELHGLEPGQRYQAKELTRHLVFTPAAAPDGVLRLSIPMTAQSCAFIEITRKNEN